MSPLTVAVPLLGGVSIVTVGFPPYTSLANTGTVACPAVIAPTCLDLHTPAYYVGDAFADAQGRATVSFAVPRSVPVSSVFVQAVVRGRRAAIVLVALTAVLGAAYAAHALRPIQIVPAALPPMPQMPSMQGRPMPDATAGITLATALVSLERRCGAVKGMGRVLARALPQVADDYDHCLIDCPPTLGMLVINALAAAELLIVPMQTEELALRSLDRLMRTLELFNNSTGRQLANIVVPTMFDRRTRASRDTLLSLRCREDITLWPDYIPVDTQLREASRLGVPLTVWQPEARGAEAYGRLLDALLEKRNQRLRIAG